MGRHIPQEIIDEVRSRSDIVDIINGYAPLKKAGASWKACCPFHNEKTPSFTVSPERQTYHCFGCGKGGNVFSFVMEKEAVDFPNAVRLLASRCGVMIPDKPDFPDMPSSSGSAKSAPQVLRDRLYSLHKELAAWFARQLASEQGARARDYLAERGIPEDTTRAFGLGYAPESWDAAISWGKSHGYTEEELVTAGVATAAPESKRIYDRFRGRLVFPIWNEQGAIVAFSARTLEKQADTGAKYVNSPETPIFKKGNILYALALARQGIRKHGFAILCEGQLDVIAMHRAGFDNSAAPQGTAFTDDQARMLKRYTERVHLCFDGDAAGQKAIARAVDLLLPMNFEIKVIRLPPGDDPDSVFKSMGAEGVAQFVNGAVDFFEYLLSPHTVRLESISPFDKSKIVDEFLEKLSRIENSVMRTHYATLLADALKVSESSVFTELNRTRKNAGRKLGGGMQAGSPAPHRPAQRVGGENRSEKALETLLTLSLLHGTVAHRVEEELPAELISDTPVGKALNTVVSMTINGEWENAGAALAASLSESPDPALSRILSIPETISSDLEVVNKMASDCLKTITVERIDVQIKELMGKMRIETAPERKKELVGAITLLQKKRQT